MYKGFNANRMLHSGHLFLGPKKAHKPFTMKIFGCIKFWALGFMKYKTECKLKQHVEMI